MNIQIIKGVVRKDDKEYGPGKTVELDDKEALSIIKLGMAKKAGPARQEEAKKPEPPKT